MSPLIVSIAAFLAVAALVGAVASVFFRDNSENKTEDRLALLTRGGGTGRATAEVKNKSVLQQPLDAKAGIVEEIFEYFGKSALIFEQANTSITPSQFGMLTGIFAVVGLLSGALCGLNYMLLPLCALSTAILPYMWLVWKRNHRLSKFGALNYQTRSILVSRALRAGHSLASGFNLVSTEMSAPINVEFGRVFEEQNLGIAMEDALVNMTHRVPNLDLRFFCTAVILQRTTGGDLAEILDKIGHLVRERFKILGQVQALTGEGRLSGIVLLALPPVLFLAVYRLNAEYIMLLFNDPMGTQMLIGAVVMQILGALVIRKIINIKV